MHDGMTVKERTSALVELPSNLQGDFFQDEDTPNIPRHNCQAQCLLLRLGHVHGQTT